FLRFRTRYNANSYSGRPVPAHCFLAGSPGVANGCSAYSSRRCNAGGRGSGDEHFRDQLGRNSRLYCEIIDREVSASKAKLLKIVKQALHNRQILDYAVIAVVMLGTVTKGDEVVYESARDHIQVYPTIIEVTESCHHFRCGVGMHIY